MIFFLWFFFNPDYYSTLIKVTKMVNMVKVTRPKWGNGTTVPFFVSKTFRKLLDYCPHHGYLQVNFGMVEGQVEGYLVHLDPNLFLIRPLP